ncbi:condensation protein [Streptomyces sp. DSM 44917]|uniref:Condensation protein n=1 Tax=Streptomyces boetiae TaxID=3075541 RepID=A0ABU2L9N1_9ACTN|nr:condensation protein [Streptomyces sp. DSM 44917]MDT0308285.1 condensation protein [Streptomyces sp. DSM 44917]
MTTARPASSPAAAPAAAGGRRPFPLVDEISRHVRDEREPETVHIEVHLPGTLDPERLRAAFHEALRRHPGVLVREAPGPWYRLRYEWEPAGGPDADPLEFPASRDLAEARARAVAEIPPLSAAPPVRMAVVRPGGAEPGTSEPGAVLFLTVNHTALDGPACLRILQTAADLYRGGDAAPQDVASSAPAAPAVREFAPEPRPRQAGQAGNAGPTGNTGNAAARPRPPAVPAWRRPARVARGTPDPAPGRPRGNGIRIAEVPVPGRPPGAPWTVNDQLLVAAARAIAEWNAARGARPRPLRVTMPIDDRDPGPAMPIGNGTRLVEVPFRPEELTAWDTPRLLRATAARTRALKALGRPQLGPGTALLTAPYAPVAWRAALTRGLRRAAAPWISTVLVSNLGRIPHPLDFGPAGRPGAIWFSAPARMPRGLALTASSVRGRLHLVLRWSTALLGARDGAELLDAVVAHLAALDAAALNAAALGRGKP